MLKLDIPILILVTALIAIGISALMIFFYQIYISTGWQIDFNNINVVIKISYVAK